MKSTRRQFLAASAVAVAAVSLRAADEIPLVVVVMDPLAKDLSCPCVAGYGQRDYNALGKAISDALGRPVAVHFHESLDGALKKKTAGRADLVIGKDSVVRAQAKDAKIEVVKLASLTGKDGATTQEGLLVVHSSDPALSADQLKDYRILFGMAAAEEKNAAAKELLKDLGVAYAGDDKDIAPTCSECATAILEHSKKGEKVCGVISSYALPLLEGCGTVKKGDLRVIGKTDPVPFISAFATAGVPADLHAKIKTALLSIGKNETLCKVMETKLGFVEPQDKPAKKK